MSDNSGTSEVNPPLNVDGGTQTTVFQSSQTPVSHCIALLGPTFDCVIFFLSAGTPFWYFCLIHPRVSEEVELSNVESAQTANNMNSWLPQYWRKRIQQLSDIWKAHRVIVGTILPPTFTLISVSALPKCSWAYIFAVLCLLYGSITFAVCTIHGIYFRNIEESHLHFSSRVTLGGGGFFNRDTLRFYVSLSLPTVWFTGFLGSFALSILMVMVGEQDSPHEIDLSTLSTACKGDRLKFLQAIVPLMFVIAAISLLRMKWALRDFPASQEIA